MTRSENRSIDMEELLQQLVRSSRHMEKQLAELIARFPPVPADGAPSEAGSSDAEGEVVADGGAAVEAGPAEGPPEVGESGNDAAADAVQNDAAKNVE